MRLNFSELHVVAFKQNREDKDLETICTFANGGRLVYWKVV